MKMWKQVAALCLGICCLVSLTACGGQGKTTQTLAAYTVTDVTGHQLKLTQKPRRIVSLNVSTDEILAELVGPERIAAFSKLADNAGISTIPTEDLRKVKLRVDAHGTEALLAARPDLVVLADWRGPELAESLRGVGVNVFVYKTPTTVQDIKETITLLGQVTGEPQKAAAMVAGMDKSLQGVRDKLGTIPKEKQVKVVALSFMGAFGGKETTFDDECTYAQVRNMVSEKNIFKSGAVSKEAIVEMNPEVLIMPSWDFGEKKSARTFLQETLTDPSLQSVTAIQKKRLVQIHDAYLYSTSQACVKAVEELARAAYPEKFKE
jgi:iron complex transport system substrate-binding protein